MEFNLPEGYYKVFHQVWMENPDEKTGWEGFGWSEPKDFELVEYLEEDKYGNPTKALFKYEGAVFLGHQHAAMNIQARLLGEFINYCKEYHGKTFVEIFEVNPEFKRINDCIDLLEERYEIKKYRNNE